jgi:hypothetical protein
VHRRSVDAALHDTEDAAQPAVESRFELESGFGCYGITVPERSVTLPTRAGVQGIRQRVVTTTR